MRTARLIATDASPTECALGGEGATCVIGRAPDCTVRVADPRVSRRHAHIVMRGASYAIEDLSSANGTFVNGRRISGEHPLTERDVITIGSARIRLQNLAVDSTGPHDAPDSDELVAVAEVKPPTPGQGTQPVRLDPREEIERLHRKLAVMYQLSELVSQPVETHVLLQRVADRLLDVFPQATEAAAIILDERGTGGVRSVGLRRRDSDRVQRSAPISREVVERVARHGHAVLLRIAERLSLPAPRTDDGRISVLDPRSLTAPPTGFRMAAPLMFRDDTYGILHVQASSDSDAFDQADLDLLGGIASQVAVALRMSRTLEQQRVQERIEKDLSIAREIQRNLLPREPPKVVGIDFAVHYEPAFRIGGDFYDFVWLDETHLGLVIGDVSGKAVSGALFMARVASEIRAQAALQREPRRILRRVNRAIAEASDDGVFCTALVMSIDLERNVARLANAAHTLPLLGRDGRWTPIDDTNARSTPLGITPEADAGEIEIQLQAGDRILLYTDGLIEAAVGETEILYGEDRLRDALSRAGEGARSVIETVLEDVDRFVGGTPQRDDQTLVCMHIREPKAKRFGSAFPPPIGRDSAP